MDARSSSSTRPLYRGTQVTWYIFGVIEALLVFRLLLKLLGANAAAGFTNFVYSVTSIFVAPFQAVFPSSRAEGSVFEWTTLLALFVYWMIAWGIVNLFVMGKSVSIPEAAVKLDDAGR